MRNTLIIISFSIFATGCSGYVDDWPKLNDPLPDASERERIFTVADVKISSESMIDSPSLDLLTHQDRSAAIFINIKSAWVNFETALKAISTEDDTDDRLIAWSGSQLALSRVSAEINRLRNLIAVEVMPTSSEAESYGDDLKARLAENGDLIRAAKDKIESIKR